jgi:guanylate kinase
LDSKPVILCIVGESGSGKTTASIYIESRYGYPMIRSYTDRPKRYPEEDSHTFLTTEEFDNIKEEDMLAQTAVEGNRYCCVHKDIADVFNTYVIDEHGLKMLKANHSDKYSIYSMRIKRKEGLRRGDVGDERVEREIQFDIPLNEYDYIIWNDDVIGCLYDLIDLSIDDIMEKEGWTSATI